MTAVCETLVLPGKTWLSEPAAEVLRHISARLNLMLLMRGF